MPILNFGSCCIDHVYSVPHFAAPGETLPCSDYQVHPGGKGLNQSIALAAAGANVRHAGKVGEDGRWLLELMASKKIDVSLMEVDTGPTGHANIQVTPEGENSIVLFGGANRAITESDIDRVIDAAQPGEFLLVQNEISSLGYLIDRARKKEMPVVFNAAPMTGDVNALPLEAIELLVINEIEGFELTTKTEPDEIIKTLSSRFTSTNILLTLGAAGSIYAGNGDSVFQPAKQVETKDTTAAGDTYVGFFLAGYSSGNSVEDCLALATNAAAVCVSRPGAATSIPSLEEL
ncbi:MAG: ribokinase [Candidatus Azotimanducaceae bacterium WSBS_2022_MAG_OTU7]